jgi:hypothetical protein
MRADRGSQSGTDTKKLGGQGQHVAPQGVERGHRPGEEGLQAAESSLRPGYTKAMVGAALVALFSPLPGSVLVAVALIVLIAEVQRAVSERGGFPKASAKELVMSMNCDVILQWSATPAELTALGAALWRQCNRTAGDTGIYQYLDSQTLADLIAGKLPVSSPTERGGVHFRFRDEVSHDRQATIDSLRGEIPAKGVEDILVEGKSWSLIA